MDQEDKNATMSGGRAMLTVEERRAIAGQKSDSYRYKTRSFFRRRVEEIKDDVAVLEQHDPELLTELREAICDE